MNFVLGLSFLKNLIVVLFILICVAIVLIVLLQKGRGGGLSGAFGGGGGAGSLLGTKTGDFLTWVTICLVASFLVMAVLMGKFMRPRLPGAMPLASPPVNSQTPAEGTATEEQTPAPAEMPTESVTTPENGQTPVDVPQVPEEPTN